MEIKIIVGELPIWYTHAEHQEKFETAVRVFFSQWQYDSSAIKIQYTYSGNHTVVAWDQFGNVVAQFETSLSWIFDSFLK